MESDNVKVNFPEKMTDILILNIEACLHYSMYMPSGYLTREVWIDICQKIGELTGLLEAKD